MAQFPFVIFDSPRPRFVRCVSCAPTTRGAFFDVGADPDADADAEGGAGDDASAAAGGSPSPTSSGTVDVPE
jgi:hypothetical protein